jgi:hypothetical protein
MCFSAQILHDYRKLVAERGFYAPVLVAPAARQWPAATNPYETILRITS